MHFHSFHHIVLIFPDGFIIRKLPVLVYAAARVPDDMEQAYNDNCNENIFFHGAFTPFVWLD
jgi:hypothetical protein